MMNRRCRRCCCINNNYSNSNVQNALANQGVLETACNEPCSYPTYNQDCGCGFDEYDNIFPENPMLAQSYVPIQNMNETLTPCKGLACGTIFPELVSPYNPLDSMRQLSYLESTNSIGEGCNKCQNQ